MVNETLRQKLFRLLNETSFAVSYTHLRAHETRSNLVCRLLLEKKKKSFSDCLSHLHCNCFNSLSEENETDEKGS